MTRKEEIERASVHHLNQYDYSYEEGEHLDLYIKGFTEGVKWADKHPDLSQLWHDANEEPKHGSKVLIYFLDEYGKMICDFYHYINYNVLSWKESVDIFNIKQWAYPDDLLPKGA